MPAINSKITRPDLIGANSEARPDIATRVGDAASWTAQGTVNAIRSLVAWLHQAARSAASGLAKITPQQLQDCLASIASKVSELSNHVHDSTLVWWHSVELQNALTCFRDGEVTAALQDVMATWPEAVQKAFSERHLRAMERALDSAEQTVKSARTQLRVLSERQAAAQAHTQASMATPAAVEIPPPSILPAGHVRALSSEDREALIAQHRAFLEMLQSESTLEHGA